MAASAAQSPGWRAWMIVLGAGLMAGLASFAFGEYAPKLTPPSMDIPPEIRSNSSQLPIEIEIRRAASRDRATALTYGVLGAALGLVLGLSGGLIRKSPTAAITAGLLGLVLGDALGMGASHFLLPRYHASRAKATDDDYTQDIGLALVTHGGIWIAAGAAAGLALGIGLGGGSRPIRGAFGGMIGAAIAVIIYEFGGAIAFPLDETFRPMAATVQARLLAHLTVALCVSLAALWASFHLSLARKKSSGPAGG